MQHKFDVSLNKFIDRRKLLALLTGAAALPVTSLVAAEENWPDRTVTLVIGYAAGGSTDTIARPIAAQLGQALGQSFIVLNKPGAASNIGTEYVHRSRADGYTLLVGSITNSINMTLYRNPGYNFSEDFVFSDMLVKIPNILIINKELPIRTVADYINYSKSKKDGVSFGSSGIGSSLHLSGEVFKMMTGANLLHVPFKGDAPAMTATIGGQVDSMFDNSPSALSFIRAGEVRPIAVTSLTRIPALPDVPTLAESGLKNFDVESWFLLAGPKGTPNYIINKLNVMTNKILNSSKEKEQLINLGTIPFPTTPEKTKDFVLSEIKRWHEVITKLKLRKI